MQNSASVPRGVHIPLLVVTWFQFVSALAGGVALAAGVMSTFGLPTELLDGSPFDDYLWPGVILAVVIGGTQLAALIADRLRWGLAWGLFAVAGFGMTIWIAIETAIIGGGSVLQTLYFATGTAQCVLVMLALGIWPRPFLGPAAATSSTPRRPRARR